MKLDECFCIDEFLFVIKIQLLPNGERHKFVLFFWTVVVALKLKHEMDLHLYIVLHGNYYKIDDKLMNMFKNYKL